MKDKVLKKLSFNFKGKDFILIDLKGLTHEIIHVFDGEDVFCVWNQSDIVFSLNIYNKVHFNLKSKEDVDRNLDLLNHVYEKLDILLYSNPYPSVTKELKTFEEPYIIEL